MIKRCWRVDLNIAIFVAKNISLTLRNHAKVQKVMQNSTASHVILLTSSGKIVPIAICGKIVPSMASLAMAKDVGGWT